MPFIQLFSGKSSLFGCQENIPCKVTIKSYHGKYVSAEPSGKANANKDIPEVWTVTFVNEDVINFKSGYNKYLVAERNGDVNANRDVASIWEQFKVVDKGDGSFNFLSYHGKYMVAEQNGDLNANRDIADTWETFKVEKSGENISTIQIHLK